MITKITISLLTVVVTGLALWAIWSSTANKTAKQGHNICIGYRAGHEITDEAYQFRLRTDPNGPELATTMTHEEWKHVYAVLNRANWNQIRSDNVDFNRSGEDNFCIEVEPGKAFTSLRAYRAHYDVNESDRRPENLNSNGNVKPFRMNDNSIAGVPSFCK